MRPSPTPTPASLPIVPLSISTKSRTLSVQRRVFRRGGTANKRGPWRTPLLRGSSWLGRQCTAEPKAGPSVPTRSQDAAAGSAPPPTTVAVHLGPAPRVCTPAGLPRLPGLCAHGGLPGSAPSVGSAPAVGTPALIGVHRGRRGGAGYLLDASIDVQVDGLGPVA